MKTTTQSNSALAILLEAVITLTFFVAVFFLLTNGLPLMEAGWIPYKSPKNKYAPIALSVFFALSALIYWKNPKALERSFIIRGFQRLSSIPPLPLAFGFFTLFVGLYSVTGVIRHTAMETRAFDLGIFAQAIWNTTQGDLLFSSLKNNINLLGDHFSPILITLAPLYRLFPTPITLLIAQVIALGACLFFLAKIAEHKTHNGFFIFTVLTLYFFSVFVRGPLHEDFHPESLAEPLLFAAFWFIEKNKPWKFLICLLIAASAKENILGITFIFGVYAFLFKQWRKIGVGLMITSAIMFLVEVKYLIPTISQKPYLYEGFYRHLMTSGPSVWLALLGGDTWEYLFKVFTPFLFLPLFSMSTLLLCLPVLLQNTLSINEVFRSFSYHYQIGLTPFLFIGTCYGFAAILKRFPRLQAFQTPFITLLLFVGLLRSGPSEYSFIQSSAKNITEQSQEIRTELAKIPKIAIVLTHNNVIPHLCERRYVYQFEYNASPTKLDQAKAYNADYVIFYERFWEPNSLVFRETVESFNQSGLYEIAVQKEGFYILKRLR